MFCKHCGNEIADDAIFCSHCGTKQTDNAPAAPAASAAGIPAVGSQEPKVEAKSEIEEAPAKPFIEEMAWNVSEYPNSKTEVEKTEDIDIDWGLDPDEIRGEVAEELRAAGRAAAPEGIADPVIPEPKAPEKPKGPEALRVAEVFDRVVPQEEAKASIPVKEALEAAGKIETVGQFNTFNRKNEEFQKLLDREYEKVRGAGPIGDEQVAAEEVAARKLSDSKENMDMDNFLQKEGAVKFEAKEVESDLLARIEALDRQKAQKEAEEAARIKALEEARLEALAKKKAEEEARNAQLEAQAAAEAEIREAEAAEARRKAEEDAARLEAIARKQAEAEAKAQEEQRMRAAEEARARAEEEARRKAEEEARAKAEELAKAKAEEDARQKIEADLRAQQEAARIRAQQEAAKAAREEAEYKAAMERKAREDEIARLKKEAEEKQRARSESSEVVEDEVRKAFEQTAKMRQEEEDKIKAALAGIRGGRFSDTLSATEKAEAEAPAKAVEEKAAEAASDLEERKTILAERDKIEEAHRHTQYNIEGMAKAREDFFADLPGGDPQAAAQEAAGGVASGRESVISPSTRTVDKEAIAAGLSSTKKIPREELAIGEALGVDGTAATDAAQEAAPAFGTADLLNQFASVADKEPTAAPVEEAPVEEISVEEAPVEEIPMEEAPVEELSFEPPVEELSFETPEEEVPVEMPLEDIPTETVEEIPLEPVDEGVPTQEQLERDPSLAALMAEKPGLEDTMVMPQVNKIDEMTGKDIASYGEAEAAELKKLQDVVKAREAERQENEAAAAAELAAAEEAAAAEAAAANVPFTGAAAAAEVAAELAAGREDIPAVPEEPAEVVEAVEQTHEEPQLSAKELKKQEKAKAKEARRLAKQQKKEEKQKIKEDTFGEDEVVEATGSAEEGEAQEKKGGKGRLILMIILIILCVIFALELIGIGIKAFASTSAAAQFIDNILNHLIHMITGESGTGTV